MHKNHSPLPTFFISHGGGPWPWLKQEMPFFDKLEAALTDMPRQIGRTPAAVLMVSGHWEEDIFTVQSNPHPPMLYDYGGFPDFTYRIRYDAPGPPELAHRVHGLIEKAGLAAALDAERGFDHGTFVPMSVIYPKADVPVLQVSLKRGFDPMEHIALGKALAPLRDEDVLIIGSGLSYHNLRAFNAQAAEPSRAFDDWLNRTIVEANAHERIEALAAWSSAPAARIAHPMEDHLIPLMVAVGAAGDDAAVRVYHQDDLLGGISVSSFRFGAAAGDDTACHPSTAEAALTTLTSQGVPS